MTRQSRTATPQRFKLLDRLLAVVFLAMLAIPVTLALPAYQDRSAGENRSNAKVALLALAGAMEQHLALGGTYENAVVVDGDKVLSPGGLRHDDEAVRHKMLDALGDLALAGAPLLAGYHGHKAGHALTNDLLRALFARPDAYEWVTCDAALAARLPGADVHWDEVPQVA